MSLASSNREWVAAISGLCGSFQRVGFQQGYYLFMMTVVTGVAVVMGGFVIQQYWQSGSGRDAIGLASYCGFFVLLLYYLFGRLSLRYVFAGGTVRAFNTWGKQLWSEDLTGLTDIAFVSGRGANGLKLIWPNRKRTLERFSSMDAAVEASIEAAHPSSTEFNGELSGSGTTDSGPAWVCPSCHEENPGNFDECWKCLADRPVTNS